MNVLTCLSFLFLVALSLFSSSEARKDLELLESFEERLNYEERIVGGQSATLGQFKYAVRIEKSTSIGSSTVTTRCGGTLILRNMVITSASCVEGQPISSVRVQSGLYDENVNPLQNSAASNIIIHPDYDNATAENDIALIRLANPFTLDNNVNILRLPTQPQANNIDSFKNMDGTVVGWGADETKPFYSNTLRFMEVPIKNHAECKNLVQGFGFSLTNKQICTNSPTKAWCFGDFGDGLVVTDLDCQPTLVGVGVRQFGCKPPKPNVYVSLGPYLAWILANGGPEIRPN